MQKKKQIFVYIDFEKKVELKKKNYLHITVVVWFGFFFFCIYNYWLEMNGLKKLFIWQFYTIQFASFIVKHFLLVFFSLYY